MNTQTSFVNSFKSSLRGVMALLSMSLLGGCASFNEVPTYSEVFAEQVRCSKSVLCRTFIEDKPPVLKLAINDAPIGVAHAEVAACILEKEGIETRRVTVRLPGSNGQKVLHTFLSARIEGDWYAVDTGALPFCGRVCTLAEALHNVELISDTASTQFASN